LHLVGIYMTSNTDSYFL